MAAATVTGARSGDPRWRFGRPASSDWERELEKKKKRKRKREERRENGKKKRGEKRRSGWRDQGQRWPESGRATWSAKVREVEENLKRGTRRRKKERKEKRKK